jgi:hypothetical protein
LEYRGRHLLHFDTEHRFEHRLAQKTVGDWRLLKRDGSMTIQKGFGGTFAEMASAAISDLASAATLAGFECDVHKILVDIAPAQT